MLEWGLVAGAALLVAIATVLLLRSVIRSRSVRLSEAESQKRSFALGAGLSIGMAAGSLVGAFPWILTGEIVWWVLFLAAGMSIGMAVGNAWGARR